MPKVVGIEKSDKFTARCTYAYISRNGGPAAVPVKFYQTYPTVIACSGGRNIASCIGRAIINYDNFKRIKRLRTN